MPQPTELAAESSSPSESGKSPLKPVYRRVPGPRGYGVFIEGGVKLKSDPETGKVSLDESDPYTREYAAKQKASQPGSGARIEADRLMAAARERKAK